MSISTLARAIASLAFVASGLSAAPQYYLFNGGTGFHIDPASSSVVNSFETFFGAYHVAIVNDRIRLGLFLEGEGHEYLLDGTDTGGTFSTGGAGFAQLLDGTSDGQYNYGVECCDGTNSVFRMDLNWENGAVLFDLPTHGAGITYDLMLGTLWVGLYDGTVRQYTTGGVEVSSFSIDAGTPAALAYEAATDTLWLHSQTGNNVSQYSKSGTLLQTVQINDWNEGTVYGGEIVNAGAVPEPGTFGLLGLGFAAAAGARRFRR